MHELDAATLWHAMNNFTRAFPDSDLRIREGERIIAGIVAPFGIVARVSDGGPSYDEQFAPGAFTRSIRERGDRVKLLVMHNRQSLPIGRAIRLEETPQGLFGEFRVSRTTAGDEALTLARDGTVDSFSVGFTPVAHTGDYRSGITRTEVRVNEASLVGFPAYQDAKILAVRSATQPRLSIARRRLELARLNLKD